MKQLVYVVIALAVIYGGISVYRSNNSGIAITGYAGPLKDGTYTGTSQANEYGTVQVAAVISGGKITDVTFLQMPSDRDHSAQLSSYAKPTLLSETLTAQSAKVNGVSGATLTSDGYTQSLQAALNQAK